MFTSRKKKMLRDLVQSYRIKTRIKKVLGWFMRLRLRRQIKTGLMIMRTKIMK